MHPDIDLVIFDCDGVLVDSEVLAVDIDRGILAEHGWELTREEVISRFLGTPLSSVQTALEERLGRRFHAGWVDELQQRYLDVFDAQLQPVAGIREVLDSLAGHSYCVASSGTPEKIRHSLGLTGLTSYFDDAHLFSASQVAHGKPAPDLFLFAAQQMGVVPARCAVVEDSHNGLAAARAAGMRSFGYAGGVLSPEQLAGEGTVVFHDMAELPALLGV